MPLVKEIASCDSDVSDRAGVGRAGTIFLSQDGKGMTCLGSFEQDQFTPKQKWYKRKSGVCKQTGKGKNKIIVIPLLTCTPAPLYIFSFMLLFCYFYLSLSVFSPPFLFIPSLTGLRL